MFGKLERENKERFQEVLFVNRTIETYCLGTFPCKPKNLETELGKQL
jgi:hypothetical protein